MTDLGYTGPFRRGDKLLEQYEVTRLLGMGGHAFVYECRDLFLDELLAVKVIPNPPNRGRDLLNRARAEAQLLRRLSHPNVVRMHTAAAIGDSMVCLVMEKLEGLTLRSLLGLVQRLSIVEALTIVRQIAVGVAAAHRLKVVHRDIKPDNVFVLPPDNHVKVLDFGIAKFIDYGHQTSNKYRVHGTPLYMSPEHLKGAGVTVRSDVYQIGTVLFELIAGVNPSLVDVQNPGFEQIAFVQITRVTPSLAQIIPRAPSTVDWLIQKATAKEASQRFASMDEFIVALDRTLNEYVAKNPAEADSIRYVNEDMLQAAREFAARADQVESDHVAKTHQDAPQRFESTHPMGAAPVLVPTEKWRAPNELGRATTRTPDHAGRRQITRTFVMLALGLGTAIGLVMIWLVPDGQRASRTTAQQVISAAAESVESPVESVASAAPTRSPATVESEVTPTAAPAISQARPAKLVTRAQPNKQPAPVSSVHTDADRVRERARLFAEEVAAQNRNAR